MPNALCNKLVSFELSLDDRECTATLQTAEGVTSEVQMSRECARDMANRIFLWLKMSAPKAHH